MPSLMPASITSQKRERMLWSALVALAAAQLLAFWMLCTHQVRQAEVRHAALQVQQVAIADCLRYLPRSTLSGCAMRVNPDGLSASPAVMTAADVASASGDPALRATPVNYAYR